MPAPYVNYYHSEMPGAPTLSGAIGGMLPVLDACLADGWGLVTATSLVVSGGVATLTFAAGPAAAVRATIEVAGVTGALAALNGKFRVSSVATNTVSYAAPGVADGTATGTITMKIASSGWEKSFTGTNLRAYRSLDVSSTRLYLRVDDTATLNARWRGYEVMTDVNTGTGPFPTVAQQADPGLFAHKANNTTGTRKWMLIADSKRFLLLVQVNSTYLNDYSPLFFGDIATFKAADAYHCLINAAATDVSNAIAVGTVVESVVVSGNMTGRFIARPYTQVGGSIQCYTQAAGPDRASAQSGANAFPVGPDVVNNAIYVAPMVVNDGPGGSSPYRGKYPGVLFVPQYLGAAYSSGSVIDGQLDMAGHELLAVGYASSSVSQRYMVDITGPWS